LAEAVPTPTVLVKAAWAYKVDWRPAATTTCRIDVEGNPRFGDITNGGGWAGHGICAGIPRGSSSTIQTVARNISEMPTCAMGSPVYKTNAFSGSRSVTWSRCCQRSWGLRCECRRYGVVSRWQLDLYLRERGDTRAVNRHRRTLCNSVQRELHSSSKCLPPCRRRRNSGTE
jgi:hypothetical protein